MMIHKWWCSEAILPY